MKVVSVDEMQRIEMKSDEAGHSFSAMMEQAGRSVAEAIVERTSVSGKQILVLVGPGNNGGDGLVAARYLVRSGADVACYLYRSRHPGEDDNFRRALEADVRAVLAEEDEGWEKLQALTEQTDLLIDALLGTGTRLPLRGGLADLLEVAGQVVDRRRQAVHGGLTTMVPRPGSPGAGDPLVVGVDGPTGLDYESGDLDARAISADLTVTFAYPKLGHFRFPGAAAIGELVVADIGIDPALADDVGLEVVTPAMVRGWLPDRPNDGHKGTFGKVMVVAGSVNYTGAAYLAGASATRAGAGLVTVALPSEIHGPVSARLAEATYVLLPHRMGVLSPPAADVLRRGVKGYDAMLVGPGLGQEEETAVFLRELLGGADGRGSLGFLRTNQGPTAASALPPLVIDADGLNILAQWKNWPALLPEGTVLTPHPGEMARLMESSVGEVEKDRVGVARSSAAEWGAVVALKGAHTVVASPDGRAVIEPFANAGLATAGTGDVLAGTVVALRAQGLGAFEAAAGGAYVHGLGGEIAREKTGAAGMVAGDVLASLPTAFHRLGVA